MNSVCSLAPVIYKSPITSKQTERSALLWKRCPENANGQLGKAAIGQNEMETASNDRGVNSFLLHFRFLPAVYCLLTYVAKN